MKISMDNFDFAHFQHTAHNRTPHPKIFKFVNLNFLYQKFCFIDGDIVH